MNERTSEEWGRLAVSLPGWRWMPGMRDGTAGARCVRACDDSAVWAIGDWLSGWCELEGDEWPDPDDPATEGGLMRLLGRNVVAAVGPNGARVGVDGVGADGLPCNVYGKLERALGRACIAAAEALGRWPGGEG
jgi:hypothetical protein